MPDTQEEILRELQRTRKLLEQKTQAEALHRLAGRGCCCTLRLVVAVGLGVIAAMAKL